MTDRTALPPLELDLVSGEDGLAWLTMRSRRGSTVPITLGVLRSLGAVLDELDARIGDGTAAALVLSSAPPFPTLSGYDLDEILQLSSDEIVGWSEEAQAILRRLELLPIPSIAAIEGEWFGGASELALACSYRVACDSPGTAIGFPQVHFGCTPAWGGTARLPRLVGLQTAYRLMLGGERVGAAEAEECGAVDRVLTAEEFRRQVEAYAHRRIQFGRPRARRARPLRRRLLDDTAPGRRLLASRAAAAYVDPEGQSAAGRATLGLIAASMSMPLDVAFRNESAVAGRIIPSSDAQGRLHSQRFAERARLRTPLGPGDLDSVAIVGASQTGSDLAYLFASADLQVRIKDARRELATQAVARARERFDWERDRDRITPGQAKRRSARVKGVTGFGGFGTLDLVVATADGTESPVEELLLEVEPHVSDRCVLAFHDWAVATTRVQRGLRQPERVIALAPSLPVDLFPLLEIVPGALTAPEAVASIRRLARRLGLTAVVVSDETPSPGTRLLAAYLAEGARLLDEGATVTQIDEAAEKFGFLAGPMYRIDAIGTRRTFRLLSALAGRLGDGMTASPALERVARTSATLYRYRSGVPAGPNPALPRAAAPSNPDVEAMIRQRLLLRLINEAACILEEGGVSDAGDLEMISILALGFPREHGGILFYAQDAGLASVVADLTELATRLGRRFAPAGLLRDLAVGGRGFFTPRQRSAGVSATLTIE